MATNKKDSQKSPVTIVRNKKATPVRKTSVANDYPALLAEVKARIQSAQYAALRTVNKELVALYWHIGG